ncbi:Aste57867_14625 [Aphanomyces stellatus]|uniref:Aste57867_14625 protein n=1 Tax=Aphanomyces stellatus TaxID=120398 RepID=A0A485L240_9STRA|nr:hypothetical protein As57867_014570 [Aphanomyces stellatus]VFT91444.1 Aste57867_14625 [Aphanomyces stellatus]
MAEGGDWDVMADLPFLIAMDNVVQRDFDALCDILDDDNSSALDVTESPDVTAPLAPPKPKKKRVRVNTARAEIQHLRCQVTQLKMALLHAQETHKATLTLSEWAVAARREGAEKKRALHENEQLRTHVTDGHSFIQHMQAAFAKKPRWTRAMPSIGSDEWQSYKLAAQTSLRVTAIHAIADREYRRQTNAFIRAGVIDVAERCFRAGVINLATGQRALEVVSHVVLPLPCELAMQACWRTFNGEMGPLLLDHASVEVRMDDDASVGRDSEQTIERIDDHTNYERFCHDVGRGDRAYINTIRKWFQEDNVIVLRTVLEDATEPHMSRGSVDNMAQWIVAKQVKDGEACGMTSVIHLTLGDARDASSSEMDEDAIDELVTAMHALSCDKDMRPPSPSTLDNVPYLATYLRRAKLFQASLKASIADAMATFKKDN